MGGINMSNMSILLPYRKKGTAVQFLLKREYVLGWDQHPDLCGISYIGPDNELESKLLDNFNKEVESSIDSDDLIRLGVCAVKRQSEHICYLYAVDLTHLAPIKAFVDTGSEDFLWANDEKLLESIDPQLLTCYAKLKYLVLS